MPSPQLRRERFLDACFHALLVAGAGAIVYGVSEYSSAAAWIAAGVAAITYALRVMP